MGRLGDLVEAMTMAEKQQASVWRDLIEPGWREREVERVAKFLAAVPVRQSCRRIGCMAPEISCAAGEASHAECQHFAPTSSPLPKGASNG